MIIILFIIITIIIIIIIVVFFIPFLLLTLLLSLLLLIVWFLSVSLSSLPSSLIQCMIIVIFINYYYNDHFCHMTQNIYEDIQHIPLFNNLTLNPSPSSAAYMRQGIGSASVQIMACRLFSTKPLFKPMLGYCQLDSQEQTSVKF